MTNPNYTAIAIICDRSGSMTSIKRDAEGALNNFVEEQKAVEGRATVRFDQFDTVHETVFKSTDIQNVQPITIHPRGGTALLDAIGRTVNDLGAELRSLPEAERPGNVLVVVVTDGEENSSVEYRGPAGKERIASMIREQQDKYGWNFVFLAANQDAISVGMDYGFNPSSSLTFATTTRGIGNTSASLSGYATTYRGGGNASFSAQDRLAAVEED